MKLLFKFILLIIKTIKLFNFENLDYIYSFFGFDSDDYVTFFIVRRVKTTKIIYIYWFKYRFVL